jgi:uncharacterized phage protein (TIGR01671 family)
MRDIKFRAWLIKEKTMVSVSHLQVKQPRYITTRRKAGGIFFNGRYELMQYTGLKDKNGVEIYEGDIVQPYLQGYKGELCVIKYLDHGFTMCDLDTTESMDGVWYFEVEIIGNIYENPELLEGNR